MGYFGFSLAANMAVFREGYVSADGCLAHLANVQAQFQAAQQAADIDKIEVHGPKSEVDKLVDAFKGFTVTFWEYVDGAFFVPAKYQAASDDNTAPDSTVSVHVYWKISDTLAFLSGAVDFQALTREEEEIRFYGFAMCGEEAVCREGYDSAEGFLSHLRNVAAPLEAAKRAAEISKIEVHGPIAEVEKLKGPLRDFPVTFWGYPAGAFMVPSSHTQAPSRLPESVPGRCVICMDQFPISNGIECIPCNPGIKPHFVCAGGITNGCLESYIRAELENVLTDDRRLEVHRARGGRLRCPSHACGCNAEYTDGPLARALPDALFSQYRMAQDAAVEQRIWQEAQSRIQAEVQRRVNQRRNDEDPAQLAEGLRRMLPNARQCGKCGYGPVDHFACDNLRSHHGENRGTARVNNGCPRCGWFANNINAWPKWDGKVHS